MTYQLPGRSSTRRRIYQRDMGMCCYCGKFTWWEDYDLDHRIPRSMGGGHEDANLAVSHKVCNRRAGQRLRQPGAKALPLSAGSRW